MTARKPARFKPPATVNLLVNRNGAIIECTVPWKDRVEAMSNLLTTMRNLTKAHPELIPELSPVMGGSQSFADDDVWLDRKRAIGFHAGK